MSHTSNRDQRTPHLECQSHVSQSLSPSLSLGLNYHFTQTLVHRWVKEGEVVPCHLHHMSSHKLHLCMCGGHWTHLLHHDKLQYMSAERQGEDLRQQQSETHHTTHSTKHLQSLWSGCGLDQRIEASLAWLVEEGWLHLRRSNTTRVFDD